MINRTTIVGRLTKDPELRYTSSTNIATCQFTVAVNRTFTNQAGEREADFIPCIAWRKQAENLVNHMKKGSLVGIDGRLQTRTYDAQDGSKRFVMEIVAESIQFLESKNKYEQAPPPMAPQEYQQPVQQSQWQQPQTQQAVYSTEQQPGFVMPEAAMTISDDDLPF